MSLNSYYIAMFFVSVIGFLFSSIEPKSSLSLSLLIEQIEHIESLDSTSFDLSQYSLLDLIAIGIFGQGLYIYLRY